MKQKKILITGAHGFIGKNIVEKLKNKYSLLTPNSQQLNLLNTQAVDNFFKANNIDVVINCALVGGSRKEEFVSSALKDNLQMFFNLIRNKDKFKKMIHLGSGAEYDKANPIIEVKETDFGITIPQDDYGFFKYLCSKYIEKENNIVGLRIFGLFGKYEDFRYRFISNAIVSKLEGLPITIQQNVFFDYVDINDFIAILDYFINHKSAHHFYNIGTGKRIDLLTIAKKINEISGKHTNIKIIKTGLNNEYSCSNERLMKELQVFSFTSLHVSLKELFSWYQTKWIKN